MTFIPISWRIVAWNGISHIKPEQEASDSKNHYAMYCTCIENQKIAIIPLKPKKNQSFTNLRRPRHMIIELNLAPSGRKCQKHGGGGWLRSGKAWRRTKSCKRWCFWGESQINHHWQSFWSKAQPRGESELFQNIACIGIHHQTRRQGDARRIAAPTSPPRVQWTKSNEQRKSIASAVSQKGSIFFSDSSIKS